jgi:FtsH-binding integral membrane protein
MSYHNQQQEESRDEIACGFPVVAVSSEERETFIERTYLHLAGAVGGCALLTTALLSLGGVREFAANSMAASGHSWMIVLGLFMAVSYVADRWARSSTSLGLQYAGLILYVLAQAVIFVPLLMIAQAVSGPENPIIFTAGVSTMAIFAALTGFVLYTKRDLSWLRGALMVSGLTAMGLIFASLLFGFSLGIIFTVAMIAFAACYILYDTSNILHRYRTDQYVAASLGLFASVALLFWYVVRLLIARRC